LTYTWVKRIIIIIIIIIEILVMQEWQDGTWKA